MDKASVIMMDRWHIKVSESSYQAAATKAEKEEEPPGHSNRIPYNIVNNYFSIGVVST